MKKRLLASLLSLAMVLTLLPTAALAAGTEDEGLCPHHTEHTAECGYAAPTEGTPCAHVHTEACYSDGILPTEGEEKAADACTHVHDTECGYSEGSEGSPCTFVCNICPVEAMIEALPAYADATPENVADIESTQAAYDALTEEEQAAVAADLAAKLAALSELAVSLADAQNTIDAEPLPVIEAPVENSLTATEAADATRTVEADTGWYNTSASTFYLYDAADLVGLAAIVNGTASNIQSDSFKSKTIYLGADIDLSGIEWEPIGITTRTDGEPPTYTDHSFQGTFDGQGYTISNLTMTSSDTDKPYYNSFNTDYACYGFFGGVNGGTVKNVTFTDVNISEPNDSENDDNDNNNTVAAAVGAAINGATLENITVSGTVTGVSRAAGVVGYVGGFSAENSAFASDTDFPANSMGTITIRNCVNHAKVESKNTSDTQGYASASGICATVNQSGATSGTVSFVGNTNDGSITGHPCAGILATAWSNSNGNGLTMNLTGNTNRGTIKETTSDRDDSARNAYAAGIAILNSRTKINCTLDGNENYGAVTSEYGNAAGIIRVQKVNTENSGLTIQFGSSGNANYGNVTGAAYAGGIMDGEPNAGTVLAHLTNTGTITTTANSGTSYAGGIVASMDSGTLDGSSCTNTGTVNAGDNCVAGSLVGQVEGSVTLKNISDGDAIGRVTIAARTERTLTLENVEIDTLSVVSLGDTGTTSSTSTFVLTGSSIGTMDVSGHFSNGMNMAISGGEVDNISVHDLTAGNAQKDLSLKVDENAEIGTFKVDHQSNKLSNLYVTTTAGSSIDTIDVDCGVQKAAVHIGKLSENDNSNANAGQITTVRTDGTTVNIIATSGASPENVLYVTDNLVEGATANAAKDILSGSGDEDAPKNFTGVVLAEDEELESELTIASGKTLVVDKDVTLNLNNQTLSNSGTIRNSGTIKVGVSSAVESLGTVNNYDGGKVVYGEDGTTATGENITNYYTVTFAGDGGSPVPPAEDVAEGSYTIPDTPVPTRGGYWSFQGWQSSVDENIYQPGAEVAISADTTFTAQWRDDTPTGGGGGGGGGSTTYAVSVDAGRHGDVTVRPTRAERGDTVTITVDPDEGYELDELTVTDANGDEISVRDRGDGTYTFTMPRGRVTVEATFVEIVEEPEALPFVDVPTGAYYYDAVAWAVENGVTNGTSATTFGPDVTCTRAQMVTFLWRAAGSPEPENTVNPFTDVSASAYYYDAVLWAVGEGITNGTSATTFSPDATVTRGQTVTFLWRNAGSPAASGSSFTDVASDAYYATAVAWAAGEGITSGTSATTFSPDANCTRAQIVTFLYRYMA